MYSLALTFPLLFIFHDLEEIIGMKRFVNRTKGSATSPPKDLPLQ